MTEPAFTKEDLVSVYAAIVEVSQSEDGQEIEGIAEVAEMDVQTTELALDELEHMGFVELQDGSWSPNLLLDKEG
jgi:predicted transcriptional regulator